MGRTKEATVANLHPPVETQMKRKAAGDPLIPPVNAWDIHAPSTDSKGLRTVPVSYEQHPITLIIQDAYSPFEPSAFIEGSPRKTLTLNLSGAWDDAMQCFEACLLHEMAVKSPDIFGRTVGQAEVQEMYKPLSRKVGEHPRSLRVKLNTAGFYAAAFWSPDKTRLIHRLENPESLAGRTLNVRVALRAIWVGDEAWGVVADCTDVQLTPMAPEVCPF